MRRAPVIVRRLARHRLALGSAMLAVILAATLLAALTSFTVLVTGYAVRHTLAGNPHTTISVSGTVSGPAAAARAEPRVRAGLRRALPGIPTRVTGRLSSDYLALPAGVAGANAETHVVSVDGLAGQAALVSGAWPASGSGGGSGTGGTSSGSGRSSGRSPVPVAVPASLAAQLHLRTGTVVTLREITSGASIPVRVSGVFRQLHPASLYWSAAGLTAAPRWVGGFTIYGPLVAGRPALTGGPIPPAAGTWTAVPDLTGLGAGDLTAFAGRLQGRLSTLGGASGLGNAQVTTGLPGLLSGLGTALVVARSQLAIGVLILLVVAGATLVLATALLSSQREGETAMLAARGASRWQLTGTGLAEGALLVVPAVVIGPLLGGSLLPSLARRGPLAESGLRLPTVFPAVSWLAAGAAAAACAIVIALPWVRAATSPVAQRAASGRRRVFASATHAGADLALVVLAVLAGWQLVHYAAPVSAGLDGAIGVDPVLVSAPVLALAAGAVIMLRLLPMVTRLADRVASRGRALTAAMAAWQISRRPLREAGPVLLAVLAVATAVLAVAQWSSWELSTADRAAFSTGADVRVNLPAAAPLPLGQVAAVTRAPGVRGSTPVIRLPVGLPNQGVSTVLALDPQRAARVAAIRPDLAGGSPGRLLRRLVPPGPQAGAVIPGRPDRLRFTARIAAAAAAITQPVLLLQLTDAFGISYQVTAGPVPPDGRYHSLTVTLTPRNRAAYPLRVSGLSLQYVMPLSSISRETLTIGSIRSSDTMTGRFGPPFPAARPGPRLKTQASASGQPEAVGGPVAASPGAVAVSRRGPVLRMRFMSGVGNQALTFGPPGPVAASVGFTTAPPAGPLPALATGAFLAATGQHLGSVLPVSMLGVTVTVRVAGLVSAFPTIGGQGGGLVMDQATLQQALTAAGLLPAPVAEWWLRGNRAPGLTGLPPGSTVTDQRAVAAALRGNPLAAAPQLAMLAIAAAAVILAAAGLAVSVASAGERSRDMALLRALGATGPQLRRLLCLEQAMVAIPGAAAGLVLGVVLARLIVPAVTLTATGAHPEPPVLLRLPLTLPVILAVLIAVVPVAIVALTAGREAGLASRLREEADT